MKKLIAILLMVVMCVTVLASCGGDGDATSGNNDQTADSETGTVNGSGDNNDPDSGEPQGDVLRIDETKYDGYQYTVLVAGNINYKHGTQHYGNRSADLGVRAILTHQIGTDGQGGTAADGTNQYQHGSFRRDSKKIQHRSQQCGENFHSTGAAKHMDCAQQ